MNHRIAFIALASILLGLIPLVLQLTALKGVRLESIRLAKADELISRSPVAIVRKPNCRLLPEAKGSIPVILMALGRSGSSITWNTMSRLTGAFNVAFEHTGGNRFSSLSFFDDLSNQTGVGYDWASTHLCRLQQNSSTTSGIVGFQWKPYIKSFNHEYAIGGLKEIATHQDPPIRVVYLTRNPLDRRASNLRHNASKISTDPLPAHCAIGDEDCIRKHLNHASSLVFQTGKELLHWLKIAKKQQEIIMKRLNDLNIQHLHVSYEALYHRDDANEWMRIFSFLGRGPASDLTMEAVRASFGMAPTHAQTRGDAIANYEDVRKTLSGTEFEALLEEPPL